MSIEVFDGPFAASAWAETHIDSLIESAVSHGARDWDLKPTAWGVVFEVAFGTEASWKAFRDSEAVKHALDFVPNPANVLVYRGQSLDGGDLIPRKPKPKQGAGGAALPFPLFDQSEHFGVFEALYSHELFDHRQVAPAAR